MHVNSFSLSLCICVRYSTHTTGARVWSIQLCAQHGRRPLQPGNAWFVHVHMMRRKKSKEGLKSEWIRDQSKETHRIAIALYIVSSLPHLCFPHWYYLSFVSLLLFSAPVFLFLFYIRWRAYGRSIIFSSTEVSNESCKALYFVIKCCFISSLPRIILARAFCCVDYFALHFFSLSSIPLLCFLFFCIYFLYFSGLYLLVSCSSL